MQPNQNILPKYKEAELSKEHKQLLASLPFPDLVIRQLFDFLDEMMGKTRCKHDFSYTTQFLATKGIDLPQHKAFFIKHGGVCDCQVVSVMEEKFPIDENEFIRRKIE